MVAAELQIFIKMRQDGEAMRVELVGPINCIDAAQGRLGPAIKLGDAPPDGALAPILVIDGNGNAVNLKDGCTSMLLPPYQDICTLQTLD